MKNLSYLFANFCKIFLVVMVLVIESGQVRGQYWTEPTFTSGNCQKGYGIHKTHGWTYEGEYYECFRHGKGVMIYSNGDKKDGNWDRGSFTGYGIFTQKNGYKYIGNFDSNISHGFGRSYINGKLTQEGFWYEGKFENPYTPQFSGLEATNIGNSDVLKSVVMHMIKCLGKYRGKQYDDIYTDFNISIISKSIDGLPTKVRFGNSENACYIFFEKGLACFITYFYREISSPYFDYYYTPDISLYVSDENGFEDIKERVLELQSRIILREETVISEKFNERNLDSIMQIHNNLPNINIKHCISNKDSAFKVGGGFSTVKTTVEKPIYNNGRFTDTYKEEIEERVYHTPSVITTSKYKNVCTQPIFVKGISIKGKKIFFYQINNVVKDIISLTYSDATRKISPNESTEGIGEILDSLNYSEIDYKTLGLEQKKEFLRYEKFFHYHTLIIDKDQFRKQGIKAYTEDKFRDAFEIFSKLAQENDGDAQYYLGRMYENGEGVTKNRAEAVKWYQLAAKNKNSSAPIALKRLGVDENSMATTNTSNRTSTTSGNSSANTSKSTNATTNNTSTSNNNITIITDKDQFRKQGIKAYTEDKFREAFEIFSKLAQENDGDAQYYLGRMYENGEGVAKNRAEAVKWYQLATKNKNVVAPIALKRLGY